MYVQTYVRETVLCVSGVYVGDKVGANVGVGLQ